jgi:hypothetical protein
MQVSSVGSRLLSLSPGAFRVLAPSPFLRPRHDADGRVYFGCDSLSAFNVLADFEELDLLRTVPIRSGRERPRLP